MERGIYLVFITVIFWAFIDVGSRFGVTTMALNPWGITFLQTLFGGLALIAFSGIKTRGWSAVKHPLTWAVGILRVLKDLTFIMGMVYLSATEVTFIEMFYILIGVGVIWIAQGELPPRNNIPGLAIIAIGLTLLILHQPGGFSNIGVLLVLTTATLYAILMYISEKHAIIFGELPPSGKSLVTGVTMVVISILSIGGLGILQAFSSWGFLEGSPIAVPDWDSLWQTNTLLFSLVFGVALRAPCYYITFVAVRIVKTDNFLMAISLLPFAILAVETSIGMLGILDVSSIDQADILIGSVITMAAMFNVFLKVLRHREDSYPLEWYEKELLEQEQDKLLEELLSKGVNEDKAFKKSRLTAGQWRRRRRKAYDAAML